MQAALPLIISHWVTRILRFPKGTILFAKRMKLDYLFILFWGDFCKQHAIYVGYNKPSKPTPSNECDFKITDRPFHLMTINTPRDINRTKQRNGVNCFGNTTAPPRPHPERSPLLPSFLPDHCISSWKPHPVPAHAIASSPLLPSPCRRFNSDLSANGVAGEGAICHRETTFCYCCRYLVAVVRMDVSCVSASSEAAGRLTGMFSVRG